MVFKILGRGYKKGIKSNFGLSNRKYKYGNSGKKKRVDNKSTVKHLPSAMPGLYATKRSDFQTSNIKNKLRRLKQLERQNKYKR